MKKIFTLENLVYLTIFILPVYLLQFNVRSFSTNGLDWMLLGCVTGGLVFYREKIKREFFSKKNKPVISLVGLILFGFVVSALVNQNYAVSFGIIKSWIFLPIAFALISKCIVGEDKIKNIFLAYCLSAFFVALISLVYYAFGVVTYDGRLQGFFNSPNYLAMYLAPAIFILYQLFSWNSFRMKSGALVFGAVILWALYLTQSYASWLAVILAFSLVFALEKKLNLKLVLIGLLLVGGIIFSQVEKNKFSSLINLENRSSLYSRGMIWQSAGKILKNNWFWGIGAGNFQEKYLAEQKYFPPYLEWAVPHPHNLFLTFWLYGGIFSLVGFLSLVCFWFWRILQRQKNLQLRFIGLGIMGNILFHGLVDTTYFKNDLAVIFWLLFMLI